MLVDFVPTLELRVLVLVFLRVDFLEALATEVETLGFRFLHDFLLEVCFDHGVDAEELRVVFRDELLDERKKSVDDVEVLPRYFDGDFLLVLHKDVHYLLLSQWSTNLSPHDISSHFLSHSLEQRLSP